MPNKFIVFNGNYNEIVDVLGLPVAFYSIQDKKNYLDQVELDLNRTAYFSSQKKVDEIKQELKDTTYLKDNELSYTQGNFDGGVFTESYLKQDVLYSNTAYLAQQNSHDENFYQSIRNDYTDDAGRKCAFAISYLRDEPDIDNDDPEKPDVKVDQLKRYFILCIIRHVTATSTDREVMVLSHVNLLNASTVPYGEQVNENKVLELVKQKLDCKHLSHLLEGLIVGDSISLKHFNALSNRILTNRNIDDRDFKQKKLDELIEYVNKVLPANSILESHFNELKRQIKEDPDFFEEGKFTETLKEVERKFKDECSSSEQIENKDLNLYCFDLTFNAIRLEILASVTSVNENQSDYHSKGLEIQANRCRNALNSAIVPQQQKSYELLVKEALETLSLSAKFTEKHLSFSKKIEMLKKHQRNSLFKLKAIDQALKLLTNINVVTGSDPASLEKNKLSMLIEILANFSDIISHLNECDSQVFETISKRYPHEWGEMKDTINGFSTIALGIQCEESRNKINKNMPLFKRFADRFGKGVIKDSVLELGTKLLDSVQGIELQHLSDAKLKEYKDLVEACANVITNPDTSSELEQLTKDLKLREDRTPLETHILRFARFQIGQVWVGWASAAPEIKFLKLTDTIPSKPNSDALPVEKVLFEQGQKIFRDIKAFDTSDLYSKDITQNDINQIISSCVSLLSNPVNSNELNKLQQIGTELSSKNSVESKNLAERIKVFVAMADIVIIVKKFADLKEQLLKIKTLSFNEEIIEKFSSVLEQVKLIITNGQKLPDDFSNTLATLYRVFNRPKEIEHAVKLLDLSANLEKQAPALSAELLSLAQRLADYTYAKNIQLFEDKLYYLRLKDEDYPGSKAVIKLGAEFLTKVKNLKVADTKELFHLNKYLQDCLLVIDHPNNINNSKTLLALCNTIKDKEINSPCLQQLADLINEFAELLPIATLQGKLDKLPTTDTVEEDKAKNRKSFPVFFKSERQILSRREELQEQLDYHKNMQMLRNNLEQLGIKAKKSNNSNSLTVFELGEQFLEKINTLINENKTLLQNNNYLSKLNKVLQSCQKVINEPNNSDNSKILLDLLPIISDKDSKDSKELCKFINVFAYQLLMHKMEHFRLKLIDLSKLNNPKLNKILVRGEILHLKIEQIIDNAVKLDSQDVADLCNILDCSVLAIHDPNNDANMNKLAVLSEQVSDRFSPLWRNLGIALITFTAVAFFLAGTFGAIPTGGASLALVIAGVALLTTAGIGAIAYSRQKDLAKSVLNFKDSIEEIQSDKSDTSSLGL